MRMVVVALLVAFMTCAAYAQDALTEKVGDYEFSYTVVSGGGVEIGNRACVLEVMSKDGAKPEDVKPAVNPTPKGRLVIPNEISGKKVVSLGMACFANCHELEQVVVPSAVTNIGEGAFAYCSKLKDVDLSESLVSIEEGAFYHCKTLRRFILKPGVRIVKDKALEGCEGLDFVRIPSSLESIPRKIFSGSNITSVWFDDGVEYIPVGSYSGCKRLKKVRFPKTLEIIDDGAFEGCEELSRVDLPENLGTIGARVFAGCTSLHTITIPKSVTELCASAFEGAAVSFDEGKDGTLVKDGWILGWKPTEDGSSRDVVYKMGDNVAWGAAANSPVPINLTFDSSLGEEGCCRRMRELEGSSNIVKVVINAPIKDLRIVPAGVDPKYAYIYGRSYFRDCVGVREIVLPDTVTNFPSSCFVSCTNLVRLTMPKDFARFTLTPLDILPKPMSTNLVDYLAYEDKRSMFGALIYLALRYRDDVFDLYAPDCSIADIDYRKCTRFEEVLRRFKEYVADYPDCYTKEMQETLRKVAYWHVLLNVWAPMYEMQKGDFSNIVNVGRNRLDRWNSFSDASRKRMFLQARRNLVQLCEIFAQAYDFPSACGYLLEHSIGKDQIVRRVDLYRRMARYEARLMSLYEKGSEDHVSARSAMLQYLQEISDLGFVQQAQLLQLEIENGLSLQKENTAQNKKAGTGTGWFVNESCVATCWHVVDGANSISVELADGVQHDAEVVTKDEANDVALLRVKGGIPRHKCLPIRTRGPKLADKVFTVGYPLVSLLGQAQKYTDGTISGISGIGGDGRYYQISVPIQPGNSGGPLVDRSGSVIGLTSSALNAVKTAQVTGAIPQNVNYAIKARYLTALLDDAEVDYTTAGALVEVADAVEMVTKSTVLVIVK